MNRRSRSHARRLYWSAFRCAALALVCSTATPRGADRPSRRCRGRQGHRRSRSKRRGFGRRHEARGVPPIGAGASSFAACRAGRRPSARSASALAPTRNRSPWTATTRWSVELSLQQSAVTLEHGRHDGHRRRGRKAQSARQSASSMPPSSPRRSRPRLSSSILDQVAGVRSTSVGGGVGGAKDLRIRGTSSFS